MSRDANGSTGKIGMKAFSNVVGFRPMLYSAKTQGGRGAYVLSYRNCFYLCLLKSLLLTLFDYELGPLFVLTKVFLHLYAPYYETNIAYSEVSNCTEVGTVASEYSAQIPICFYVNISSC